MACCINDLLSFFICFGEEEKGGTVLFVHLFTDLLPFICPLTFLFLFT